MMIVVAVLVAEDVVAAVMTTMTMMIVVAVLVAEEEEAILRVTNKDGLLLDNQEVFKKRRLILRFLVFYKIFSKINKTKLSIVLFEPPAKEELL